MSSKPKAPRKSVRPRHKPGRRLPPKKWNIRIWHKPGDKITILYATSRRVGHPPHMMDLEAINLNGECPCEDFQCHYLADALREKNLPTSQRVARRCDHLKAGREWLLNRFLRDLRDPTDPTSPFNRHH